MSDADEVSEEVKFCSKQGTVDGERGLLRTRLGQQVGTRYTLLLFDQPPAEAMGPSDQKKQ